MIAKGERTELKAIVKQQFKVLRSELAQRKAEMVADIELRIVDRYREVDEAQEKVMWRVHEIIKDAERQITDLLAGSGARHGDGGWYHRDAADVSVETPVELPMPRIHFSSENRTQLHRAMTTAIEADIKGALLRLDRQEADILRTLAVGALESEEAHQFLGSIPTVGELVSAARLAELEAEFATEDRS